MIEKLGREILRADKSTQREDIADHCTNSAWTAWHLVDHVWADMKGNWRLWATLAEEAGVPVGSFDLDFFKTFVLSEQQCPDLAYCRIIATQAKHVGADRGPDDPKFVIDVSKAADFSVSSPTLDWLPIQSEGHRPLWAFKIVEGEDLDGTDRTNAVHLFQNVHDYWERFVDKNEIASG